MFLALLRKAQNTVAFRRSQLLVVVVLVVVVVVVVVVVAAAAARPGQRRGREAPPPNRAIQAGTTPAALRTRGHVERKGAAKGGGSTMGFTGQQTPPRQAPAEREEGPANAPRTRDKRPPPPVPAQLLIECRSSNSNEGTFGQN